MKGIRVQMLLGSVNDKGQTARAVDALTAGLEEDKAAVERINLTRRDVGLCRQCSNDGWGSCRTEGSCVLEDGFHELIDKIRASDLCVFATPVYFSSLSESMLAFLGRLRRIQHRGNRAGIHGLPAFGICVAGGGGRGAPQCAAELDSVLHKCGFDVLDVVPARRQNLELKVELLERSGKRLGENLYRFRNTAMF